MGHMFKVPRAVLAAFCGFFLWFAISDAMGDVLNTYLIEHLSALLGVPNATLTAHLTLLIGPFLAGVLIFFIGRQSAQSDAAPQIGQTIGHTFISPFGQYKLGILTICERRGPSFLGTQTVHSINARDKLIRVKTLIPWFLYRVEPVHASMHMYVQVRRSNADKVDHIMKFGDLI
jgi:hypothetical protein